MFGFDRASSMDLHSFWSPFLRKHAEDMFPRVSWVKSLHFHAERTNRLNHQCRRRASVQDNITSRLEMGRRLNGEFRSSFPQQTNQILAIPEHLDPDCQLMLAFPLAVIPTSSKSPGIPHSIHSATHKPCQEVGPIDGSAKQSTELAEVQFCCTIQSGLWRNVPRRCRLEPVKVSLGFPRFYRNCFSDFRVLRRSIRG
jgi:hypothetical protein